MGSSESTVRMKYLISLTVTNIILLASGFGMCFLGLHFNGGYHMNRLDFITKWLKVLPYSLIGLGTTIVAVSVLGVFSTTSRNRIGLRIYTLIVALLVVPQFFTTYATSHLNSLNAKDDMFEKSHRLLKEHIELAKKANDTRAIEDWHYIESDLRCCGDMDMNGYEFWNVKLDYPELPKSCCVQKFGEPDDHCDYKDLYNKPDHQKSGEYAIYRLGCLTILDDLYLTEVKPILQPVYMILSIVIAIVEIASVALAAAYINVLKKKAVSGT